MVTSIPDLNSAARADRRKWYLDNLKVFLTVLVVFHHAGQAYGDGGGWIYHPSLDEYAAWLGNFFPVNASFFMGLYFLISGYFVPPSYDRHGFRGFVGTKFLHLGIPLLFFTALSSLATQRIELGHMWFVEHLLFYSLLYAFFRMAFRIPHRPNFRLNAGWVLAAAALLAAVNYFVMPVRPINYWEFLGGFLRAETAHLPQYVLLFLLGIAAYRGRWFERMPRLSGRVLLGGGLLLALLVYLRPFSASLRASIWPNWWWYEPLMCLCLSFGLVDFFRVHFDSAPRLMRWMAAQSYAAYLVHIMVVQGLQVLFDRVPMGGGTGKFLFIGTAGTICSYLLAYFLRRIPGVGRIV